MEQSKVDHATKRKPTRPAKVPSGTKPKTRKTDKHIVKYVDTIHTVCEGKCEGVHFNEDDDPNFIEIVKQGLDHIVPFKLDNSSEKTDIEILETGEIVTQEEEQAVDDLLRALRFMNQATQTDPLPSFEMQPGEFHPVVSQIDSECLTPKQREQCLDKELKKRNAEQATKPLTLHPFPPRWNPNFFNGSLEENIQKRYSKTEEQPDSIKFDRPGEYSKTGRQYVVIDRNNIIINPSQLKGHVYDDAMVRSWLKDHPDEATFKPGWVNF